MGGYRAVRYSACGRAGYLLYGPHRDGTLEVGSEPVHAAFEGVLGASEVPVRALTPEEADCDLERVRHVQDS